MDIEGTYGDELTLWAFSNTFNIEIKIVSTLSNDGGVSINPENSNPLRRITLGHFVEGQGDHDVWLQRKIAEDDETQQQDLDDIAGKYSWKQCWGNTTNKRWGKRSGKLGGIKKIFLYCLITSSFEFPNYICWTYNKAIKALPVFKPFQQMGLAHLPRIYINACDYLSKPRKNGELVVNIHRLLRNSASASGIVMELKRIVQSRFWNTAWLVLLSWNYGWYVIKNIFWKKKS